MDKDIEFFRAEYKKQKKLENIVNSRILFRPKIKKWQVAMCFAILPFLMFFAIFLPCFINVKLVYKILIAVFSFFMVLETYLRFCLICVVKCYQRYAKEETRRRCKCIPSCSEYTILTLKSVYPLIVALLKIRKRLRFTCNGDGYKIDFPYKRWSDKFESKL